VSSSTTSLTGQIASAGELQGVVRTMKALAASSVGQYERSLRALGDYDKTVELGLAACLRDEGFISAMIEPKHDAGHRAISAVVFGSDQGLVGQFNDVVVELAIKTLAGLPGKPRIWAVGERAQALLADSGVSPVGVFVVPSSVAAIAPLVGRILVTSDSRESDLSVLYLLHNRPSEGALYAPVSQRLLPLDESWRRRLAHLAWPSGSIPEVLGSTDTVLQALIHEYLFISLYRACAESLASENASRLAAMERADRNIRELLERLRGRFHRLRQSDIDEELFDVISGFEALILPNAKAP
jgi:F-type H+-transporting ATPase subunit gamma